MGGLSDEDEAEEEVEERHSQPPVADEDVDSSSKSASGGKKKKKPSTKRKRACEFVDDAAEDDDDDDDYEDDDYDDDGDDDSFIVATDEEDEEDDMDREDEDEDEDEVHESSQDGDSRKTPLVVSSGDEFDEDEIDAEPAQRKVEVKTETKKATPARRKLEPISKHARGITPGAKTEHALSIRGGAAEIFPRIPEAPRETKKSVSFENGTKHREEAKRKPERSVSGVEAKEASRKKVSGPPDRGFRLPARAATSKTWDEVPAIQKTGSDDDIRGAMPLCETKLKAVKGVPHQYIFKRLLYNMLQRGVSCEVSPKSDRFLQSVRREHYCILRLANADGNICANDYVCLLRCEDRLYSIPVKTESKARRLERAMIRNAQSAEYRKAYKSSRTQLPFAFLDGADCQNLREQKTVDGTVQLVPIMHWGVWVDFVKSRHSRRVPSQARPVRSPAVPSKSVVNTKSKHQKSPRSKKKPKQDQGVDVSKQTDVQSQVHGLLDQMFQLSANRDRGTSFTHFMDSHVHRLQNQLSGRASLQSVGTATVPKNFRELLAWLVVASSSNASVAHELHLAARDLMSQPSGANSAIADILDSSQ